jgi:hypothetical protein
MRPAVRLRHEFVDNIPGALEPTTLYICIPYATVIHLCVCGCGWEVVTPLGPTDWRVTFDGETVSLHPSVGNWSYPCRSHYVVRRNEAHWAPAWSAERIERGRREDRAAKAHYFRGGSTADGEPTDGDASRPRRLWNVAARWMRRRR